MPRFRFPAAARVKKRDEFLAIQDNGRKFQAKLLTLFVRNGSSCSRLGITVSKRVHRDSSTRNRVRRRLREMFRLHLSSLSTPCDLVVIARSESAVANYQELESCLLRLLQQANVLKPQGGNCSL